MKDIYVVGDRMTKNGLKMTNSKNCLFFNQKKFIFQIEID